MTSWFGRLLAAAAVMLVVACAEEKKVARPLPYFDLTLGKTIDEIRAAIAQRAGSDEGLESPEDDGQRRVGYVLEVPESGVGINVAYSYRPADRVVWAISVANAYGVCEGQLGEVALSDSLRAIEKKLGKPASRSETAPVIDTFTWRKGNLGYRADAYSEEYGSNKPGDVSGVEVWRIDLAPSGYDGRS